MESKQLKQLKQILGAIKEERTFLFCIFMANEGNSSGGGPLRTAVTLSEESPIKLDGRNFVAWKHQVEVVMARHNLRQFVENPRIPIRYANESDRSRDIATLEYQLWLVQDQMLATWLKMSLSREMFPLAFDCRHSWQVWDTVYLIRAAMATQVRIEMKNTKKMETQSILEYLAIVRGFIDSLVEMGENVSEIEHIGAILEGLPREYDVVVRGLHSRSHPPPLAHVENFLLQHEAHLQKLKADTNARNRNE